MAVFDPNSPAPPASGIIGRDIEMQLGSHGWQLHAKREFPPGTVVAIYGGKLWKWQDARSLPAAATTHMRSVMAMHSVLDGAMLPDGTPITDPNKQLAGTAYGAAFANDARNQAGKTNNTVFDYWDPPGRRRPFEGDPALRLVVLVATTHISTGDEILVDYGYSYWEKHSLQM